MPKRSGFQSSIKEFLPKSNDEVLGALTKFKEESSREESFERRWNRARAILLKSK